MNRTTLTRLVGGAVLCSALACGALPAGALAPAPSPSAPAAESAVPVAPTTSPGQVEPSVPSLPGVVPETGSAEGQSLTTEAPELPVTAPDVPDAASDETLEDMAGPLGAKMGQGLERLLETGDPQIPTEDEVAERIEAETSPEVPQIVPDLTADTSVSPAGAADTQSADDSFHTVAKATSGNSVMSLAATWMPSGVQGLDVSSHQNNVNWATAWNQGGRFAYVKATEGTYYKNPYYNQQYNGSANVGMVRGAYHFAIPSVGSAAAEANYFVNNGGGWSADGRTLPPLLDIEYNPYPELGNTCYEMSAGQMVSWIKAFSNTVKSRTGRVPMIYTTTDWWKTCTGNSSAFADHPLHIANYSKSPGVMPAGWSTYNVWQYSSTGPFVGDSNVWNGTAATLKAFALRGGSPSIASAADVLAVAPDGRLLNYRSNQAGGFLQPVRIGTGWLSFVSVHSTDWNSDGVFDVLGQDTAGNMKVFYGYKMGGFSGPQTVGRGWDQLRITVGKWNPVDPHPGILASDTRGRGFYYANARGGVMAAPPVALGTGFENTLAAIMDFSGDGVPEVILRKANGDLVARQRSANGSAGAAKTIGVGWQDATSLRSVSGFSGGAASGILSVFADGGLRYYASNKRGGWIGSSVVGKGWIPYLLANTQKLSPPPGPSITSEADVVALNSHGNLLVYKAMAGGALRGPTKIGVGFHQVKSLHSLDWNGDGTMDVVVQWAIKGNVDVYFGKMGGGFAAPVKVGTAGWADLTVYPDTLASSSGLPGLLARDAQGSLRRYTNPNGGLLQGGPVIGKGWNDFKLVVLDWNGDGLADILGIDPAGDMSYYRRGASGNFASGIGKKVGTGWNTFPSVGPGDDVTGIGGASVVAVDEEGSLYNYQVSGAGSWADVTLLGTGWGSLTLADSN